MSFGEDPQVGVENAEDKTVELGKVGPVGKGRGAATPLFDRLARTVEANAPTASTAEGEISEQLSDWWQEVATSDMMAVVPKAVEYGSSDLKAMGQQLVALHPGVEGMDAAERERVGQEMAIAFYLLGKVTRLFGAYERGGVPSDDTIHDVTVYSMMFRRVRSEGGWPR